MFFVFNILSVCNILSVHHDGDRTVHLIVSTRDAVTLGDYLAVFCTSLVVHYIPYQVVSGIPRLLILETAFGFKSDLVRYNHATSCLIGVIWRNFRQRKKDFFFAGVSNGYWLIFISNPRNHFGLFTEVNYSSEIIKITNLNLLCNKRFPKKHFREANWKKKLEWASNYSETNYC